MAYILIGLHAEGQKPTIETDAVVMNMKTLQSAAGDWPNPVADTRPPLCSTHIGQTALVMRALQLYAPPLDKPAYDKAVQRAARWIAAEPSKSTDDSNWRVLGLAWAASDKTATQKAVKELLAIQGDDGGWADIPTMGSTVYSTGKSLYALQIAGLPATDPAYQKAVKYLLSTQLVDGSWYVKTRALAFQPYFDAGYSHGFDQWMSAAGSSWATMALAGVAPEPKAVTASR